MGEDILLIKLLRRIVKFTRMVDFVLHVEVQINHLNTTRRVVFHVLKGTIIRKNKTTSVTVMIKTEMLNNLMTEDNRTKDMEIDHLIDSHNPILMINKWVVRKTGNIN